MSERRRSTWLANRIGRVGITGVSWNSISWVTSEDSVFSNGWRQTNARSRTTRSKIRGICLVSRTREKNSECQYESTGGSWWLKTNISIPSLPRLVEYLWFASAIRNLYLFSIDFSKRARVLIAENLTSQKSLECHSPFYFERYEVLYLNQLHLILLIFGAYRFVCSVCGLLEVQAKSIVKLEHGLYKCAVMGCVTRNNQIFRLRENQ